MKQLLQNLKIGKTELVDIPCPQAKSGHILSRTSVSLISAGTERMLVDFGRASYFQKAKQQPEKVRQVLDKIRTDGLLPTIDAVRSKLDQPIPLGYCNVGGIQEISNLKSQISNLRVGDRVVSNGPHAEVVCVPYNLCAKIPDAVSDEEAAFTVVGAVGLQGVRLAQPTLGEYFVVTGLGLIGLLTVQILLANGCHVLGIDPDSTKCALAKQFGAMTVDLSRGENPLETALFLTNGRGMDGVLITATTKSSEPVHQAAQMCRERGRIVLVGVTGLELNRADFYEKELTFQVSCSYGPGRYDPDYEEHGHDYPIGYVRWTEQRNFEAILALIAEGKLNVKPLISHRFPFAEAEKAYQLLAENSEPYLGILLEYFAADARGQAQTEEQRSRRAEGEKIIRRAEEQKGRRADLGMRISECGFRNAEERREEKQISECGFRNAERRRAEKQISDIEFRNAESEKDERMVQLRTVGAKTALHSSEQRVVVGLIGAGNFTGQVLLPALQKTGVRLKTIASSKGVTGTHLGKKFGFEQSTTDVDRIFTDPEINTVVITTRHNTHAQFVIQALEAGKHVFVEKPLCLTLEELDSISSQLLNFSTSTPLLMVGFNRRFAPHVVKMKALLETVKDPKSLIMTVNAGMIPPSHWTQDAEVGGGRIIGEACHFIDLLRFLTGNPILKSDIIRLQSEVGDTVSIQLSFADGSIGTIHYFANGSKRFPKERLEVFCGGKILQLDNFKIMRGYGWKGFKRMRLWRQDKGHTAEMKAFVGAIEQGKSAPIPFEEIVEVMRVTLELDGKKFRS